MPEPIYNIIIYQGKKIYLFNSIIAKKIVQK